MVRVFLDMGWQWRCQGGLGDPQKVKVALGIWGGFIGKMMGFNREIRGFNREIRGF
jgi:hypothetical protein